jgi:hypothetical protein
LARCASASPGNAQRRVIAALVLKFSILSLRNAQPGAGCRHGPMGGSIGSFSIIDERA